MSRKNRPDLRVTLGVTMLRTVCEHFDSDVKESAIPHLVKGTNRIMRVLLVKE